MRRGYLEAGTSTRQEHAIVDLIPMYLSLFSFFHLFLVTAIDTAINTAISLSISIMASIIDDDPEHREDRQFWIDTSQHCAETRAKEKEEEDFRNGESCMPKFNVHTPSD